MASLTMTASFLGGAANVTERPPVNRRRLMVAKAARVDAQDFSKASPDGQEDKGSNGRRVIMVAAAAAAISVLGTGQKYAVAGEGDPKRGTPEAKKIFAPVCVTMPTARICHK